MYDPSQGAQRLVRRARAVTTRSIKKRGRGGRRCVAADDTVAAEGHVEERVARGKGAAGGSGCKCPAPRCAPPQPPPPPPWPVLRGAVPHAASGEKCIAAPSPLVSSSRRKGASSLHSFAAPFPVVASFAALVARHAGLCSFQCSAPCSALFPLLSWPPTLGPSIVHEVRR